MNNFKKVVSVLVVMICLISILPAKITLADEKKIYFTWKFLYIFFGDRDLAERSKRDEHYGRFLDT